MPRKPPEQRHELFARAVALGLNHADAAKEAGCPANSANRRGYEMAKLPAVRALIAQYARERRKQMEHTAEKTLEEIARIAFSDLRQFFDADGHLKPLKDLDDDVAAALASVKILEESAGSGTQRGSFFQLKDIKMWDKPRALELLARYYKLLTDKTELSSDTEKPLTIVVHRAPGNLNGD